MEFSSFRLQAKPQMHKAATIHFMPSASFMRSSSYVSVPKLFRQPSTEKLRARDDFCCSRLIAESAMVGSPDRRRLASLQEVRQDSRRHVFAGRDRIARCHRMRQNAPRSKGPPGDTSDETEKCI